MVKSALLPKSENFLPLQIFCFRASPVSQGIQQNTLFDLGGQPLREYNRIRIYRDAVDSALDQEFTEYRIHGRRLSADGNGLAIFVRDLD